LSGLLDSIPVACIRCQAENATSPEAIDAREAIKCTACGEKFSIGDLFQALYEQESLVKRSVDSLADYATKEWALDGGAAETRKKTEDFLHSIRFGELLKETAKQILIHGDAFLQVDKEWQLLSTQRVEVKTSYGPVPGKAHVLKEDGFILTTDKGTKSFGPEEIVHFKKRLTEDAAYGESMIQVTLIPLNHLREFRKALSHVQSGFHLWGNHLEQQVRLGLGVPDFVLERRPTDLDSRTAEFVLVTFVGEVRDLQRLLENGFSVAFDRAARQSGLSEAPELKLRELNERMVLIDCGFDFSKEVDALRKLHEAGIISKEDLDRMTMEYSP
jgi:hypothetical protein